MGSPSVTRRGALWVFHAAVTLACSPRREPASALDVPIAPPSDWDAYAYNLRRGLAGAIPESYRNKISGPDGRLGHIGKHLPYVVDEPVERGGPDWLPLMWGDPRKGQAPHPNAAPSASLLAGHFYDSVRVLRVGSDVEIETRFSSWPLADQARDGRYTATKGHLPTDDDGKQSIYLVHVPPGCRPGDLLRVRGHCRTHGEYVDFVRMPRRGA